MAIRIDELRAIINDPDSTPENKQQAQLLIDAEERRLADIGGARLQLAAGQSAADADLAAALAAIQNVLQATGGTANTADIRKAVIEELEKRKINLSDLSPDLLAFLNSKRSVTFTMKMMNLTTTKNASSEFLNRPLTQLILSDVMARNNVYLYGGAGTGKTFVAETLADLLGWKLITLNCNQFTSPLDILGGQTIDGYQEGKLSMAWSNKITYPDGRTEEVDGCVLLLDELPKIDPNTAGILNDALAKVKSFKMDAATGQVIAPKIMNGRNEVLQLGGGRGGGFFVIATGNVPLNTIDPDYEANFKQDLSLQDRFVGSTYEIFVDYQVEWDNVGKGFAFIWLFLVKVREKIKEIRATNQAFVSLRLMINVIETYKVYRDIKNNAKKQKGSISTEAITKPKSVIDALDNFFNLFKEAPRNTIKRDVDYDGFKRILAQKDKMPYNPDAPDFDTPEEIREAEQLIARNKAEIAAKYS